MIKEGKFGTFEAVSLMTLLIITKAFFTSIRVLIKTTGTAAWYTTLISSAGSLFLFLFVYLLIKRFPGKDLTEIFELTVGKVIGKMLSLIFTAYFIFYSGSTMREFLEMIKAYTLPYSPPSAIIFLFLLAVVVLSYLGLEAIARVAGICFIPVVATILLLLFLAYPYYSPDYLTPWMGYGIGKTVTQGLWRSSAYSDVIVLAFINKSIHGVKHFKKIGVISITISGILVSLSIICALMAFNYSQGMENVSSLYQLSRIIFFNRFFQRIESIFIFTWVISTVINITCVFYCSISIFCKAFKINNHRPLLFPMAFLTFMVALQAKSLTEVTEINILFMRQYSVIINYGIPILILFIALIFGKKGEGPQSEKAD